MTTNDLVMIASRAKTLRDAALRLAEQNDERRNTWPKGSPYESEPLLLSTFEASVIARDLFNLLDRVRDLVSEQDEAGAAMDTAAVHYGGVIHELEARLALAEEVVKAAREVAEQFTDEDSDEYSVAFDNLGNALAAYDASTGGEK